MQLHQEVHRRSGSGLEGRRFSTPGDHLLRQLYADVFDLLFCRMPIQNRLNPRNEGQLGHPDFLQCLRHHRLGPLPTIHRLPPPPEERRNMVPHRPQEGRRWLHLHRPGP
eukprot:350958_1